MAWIAENLGVESAAGSWVGLAFWTALPHGNSANAGQISMRSQRCSRVILRETGAKSKRVCFWKLPVVVFGLVLAIGVTWCLLALWAGHVAGGKLNTTASVTPTGVLRGGYGRSQTTRVAGLWVDAVSGDDGDDGLTRATAFRTIQKAADLASPGTTVHILPGIYRESVWPATSGSAAEPILYVAEEGPGTVVLRGSEPASSVTWTQLAADTIGLPPGVDPTDIYYAELSSWELEGPPRLVLELAGGGEVLARLPVAREPDWEIVTEWKHHEFWWAADGGSDVAGCDPSTDPDADCDVPWRSQIQLTDRSDDAGPAGIEPGNLTTTGDLTGATLVVVDDIQGHWTYRRTIVAHDIDAGRITVDPPTGYPNVGWGSKYYVEGKAVLLDSPGEWWYDKDSGRLYLWPPTGGDPSTMNIEVARRDNGFILRNRSYIIVDGLTVEFFNQNSVFQDNNYTQKSYHNTVRNATLRYANRGLWLMQSVQAGSPVENITDGFTLEDSEIGYMDTYAIRLTDWWENRAAPDSFSHSGVLNTVIRNNELHHLGFRSEDAAADGSKFEFAHRLRFEGNHVHHVAHNGVLFLRSVIQSPKEYDFTPDEIRTGEILIRDNVFEKACQLTTDCGALKIWGDPPDSHVFRDFLVTGNVFRDTFGWSYVSEKRGRWWSGGTGSDVQGMGGFGLYVDYASGLHVYRNIAYNNAYAGFWLYGVWRDGDIVYYNNVAANSLHGICLDGLAFDTHGSVNTQMVNNIVANNEGYGIRVTDADGDYGNFLADHNLYYSNGWRAYEDGGMWQPGAMALFLRAANEYYPTLADIQASTAWEAHGVEGNPRFWDYDADDHDLYDGSSPDFHLTAASANALDRGTTALPASLVALLDAFDVIDFQRGEAYDLGRYEAGFALLASPTVHFVKPGGVARYALQLDPPDLPHPVSLTVTSPSPLLDVSLSSSMLIAGEVVTLTVTDGHVEPEIMPALAYTVPITANDGGFAGTTSVRLFVGGAQMYLPTILRNYRWGLAYTLWKLLGPLLLRLPAVWYEPSVY